MAKVVERHRYRDKEVFETRRLVFNPYDYTEKNMCLVIGLIERNITSDLIKRKKLMYRDDVKFNKMYGHCYHASQALYYLIDTNQLKPMSAEDYRGEKHWWLQNGDRIYDATESQYYSVGKLPPHEKGKKSKWYGWQQRPQQISLDLMVRVLGERLITDEVLTY
tara:strand:+ start:29 stop:520 length:492 start_codon:yes stop_codon:yes gene_type:complete